MEEEIIQRYIAIWGWTLISMIFLTTGLITYVLPNSLPQKSLAVALIVVSLGCFGMMLKRKKEILTEHE